MRAIFKFLKIVLHVMRKSWRAFKKWYKGLYKGRPWYMRCLVAMATLVVCFILYLIAVDVNFLWLFGKSPSISSIMNPPSLEASFIYSADGVEIGKFYDENRPPVKFNEINPEFFTMLIDTEDERFYEHSGIDAIGLGRAVVKRGFMGDVSAGGGSTITQQLLKNNVFDDNWITETNIINKFKIGNFSFN